MQQISQTASTPSKVGGSPDNVSHLCSHDEKSTKDTNTNEALTDMDI